MGVRRLTGWLILVLLLVWPVSVYGQEQDNLEIANEYIRIVVNNSQYNTGRFSVGTTGGDPDRLEDDHQHLIYGGDDPWTSYTTVRIGNENWVFGNPTNRRAGRDGRYGEVITPPMIDNGTIKSVWQLGPIEVTQILGFARSSTTGLMDTARIEYQLHNLDSVSHMVGLRIMVDTMLGTNDGAPFRVNEQALLSDTVFYSNAMPEFWQAFDSLSNPRVMSQGTLRGRAVTTPDRVYFTNWGSLADDLWSFDFTPGRDYTRKGERGLDSAIALFWDSAPLAPGETRSYVTQYGLGGVTIAPGDLILGVTSPAQVTADSDRTETFSVIAYIQNAGTGEARDVVAQIELPPGLELVSGSSVRRLGNIDVGETQQTGWQVAATGTVSGDLTYKVSVRAINSEPNSVSRGLTVVSPARLRIFRLSGPPALTIAGERYNPSPFTIEAVLRNEGGTAAQNVKASILNPFGLLLAPGDRKDKFIGAIQPGEEVKLNWYLAPTGISGQLPYSVTIVYSGEPALQNNFVFVPELRPKVWISESQTYGRETISVGDYFSISVWATNISDFSRAELDLSFNPDVVEIVGKTLDITQGTLFLDESVSPPTKLQWTMPVIDNITGSVTGITGDRGPNQQLPTAFGTIVTIHFRAKGQGDAEITLNRVEILDDKGQPRQFEVEAQRSVVVK
ncbi:MAG: cellulosome anchor protein [Firmicutes bacterium]|nr:cellulosome anchor protein [Bacillota bacterium]